VQGRLRQCIDFVAAEARYHHNCNARFIFGKDRPSSLPASSSQQPAAKLQVHKRETFLMMCDWLKENTDGELLSVTELRERLVGMFGEESVYCMKKIKQELVSRYGDHIFFATMKGHTDVVCMCNMVTLSAPL